MEKITIGYHFYEIRTWYHRLFSILIGSRTVHANISIQTRYGTMIYECGWPHESLWMTGEYPVQPVESFYEDAYLDLAMLDLVLPKGEKYRPSRVFTNWITGYPRWSSSCVNAIHRLRFLTGEPIKGRSPNAIRRYFRQTKEAVRHNR